MLDKDSKIKRALDMYYRLCEGKILNKSEEARRFGVDERSIQRDIDDIRAFLSDLQTEQGGSREIIYDRGKKGFLLVGEENAMMDNSEILAVSKIILESRAFSKKEVDSILKKMIAGCVPHQNMELVSDLISNEKYHYIELHHKSGVKEMLWQMGEEIKQQNLIEITYHRMVDTKTDVKRVVQPVAVIFSEYYFYLNAYIVEKNGRDEYVHKYNYPAVFRLDRIQKYRELGQKFKIPYADRFEEGEFRKRIQFMFPGELMRLQLKYTGKSVNAILDRLPTAKIISEGKDGYIIEAEVYGKGIMMWLLSQGSNVEILKPEALRKEMKETLQKMLEMY